MTFPLTRRYSANAGPVATASGDLLTPVDSAYESETVSSVLYIPQAAQAGAATNNRQLTLYNRGHGAGTGSTVIAQLSLVSGTNLSDNVPISITLSTTSANLALASGDVLEWESLHVGSGVVDPGGRVQVNTTRTLS
jgi:hypothetical protein